MSMLPSMMLLLAQSEFKRFMLTGTMLASCLAAWDKSVTGGGTSLGLIPSYAVLPDDRNGCFLGKPGLGSQPGGCLTFVGASKPLELVFTTEYMLQGVWLARVLPVHCFLDRVYKGTRVHGFCIGFVDHSTCCCSAVVVSNVKDPQGFATGTQLSILLTHFASCLIMLSTVTVHLTTNVHHTVTISSPFIALMPPSPMTLGSSVNRWGLAAWQPANRFTGCLVAHSSLPWLVGQTQH
jgi:hypothetical protein